MLTIAAEDKQAGTRFVAISIGIRKLTAALLKGCN